MIIFDRTTPFIQHKNPEIVRNPKTNFEKSIDSKICLKNLELVYSKPI